MPSRGQADVRCRSLSQRHPSPSPASRGDGYLRCRARCTPARLLLDLHRKDHWDVRRGGAAAIRKQAGLVDRRRPPVRCRSARTHRADGASSAAMNVTTRRPRGWSATTFTATFDPRTGVGVGRIVGAENGCRSTRNAESSRGQESDPHRARDPSRSGKTPVPHGPATGKGRPAQHRRARRRAGRVTDENFR